jgi:hypothetical protein
MGVAALPGLSQNGDVEIEPFKASGLQHGNAAPPTLQIPGSDAHSGDDTDRAYRTSCHTSTKPRPNERHVSASRTRR